MRFLEHGNKKGITKFLLWINLITLFLFFVHCGVDFVFLFQLCFRSRHPNPEPEIFGCLSKFASMGDDEDKLPPSSVPSPLKSKAFPLRPTINLPPRTSMESLLSGGPGLGLGFSPGPMTLVSSFFSDSDDCKSFSQLLAGAMTSPVAVPPTASELKDSAGLPDSPGLFSPDQVIA